MSSVESLLDKDLAAPLSSFQAPQEPLDLVRKEMQAKRRQDARKRRKCLIEEKQQKKARRKDKGIEGPLSNPLGNNSLVTVVSQEGSSLHELGSLPNMQQCSEPTEIQKLDCDLEHIGACDQARAQQKLPDIKKTMTPGRVNVETLDVGLENSPRVSKGNVLGGLDQGLPPSAFENGMKGTTCPFQRGVPWASCVLNETASCASCIHAQTAPCASRGHAIKAPCAPCSHAHTTACASCSHIQTAPSESSSLHCTTAMLATNPNALNNMLASRRNSNNDDGEDKSSHSSSSELEDGGTRDEQSSGQNEPMEVETSRSRYDSNGDPVGPMYPSMVMPSNTMVYSHPFSVLPVPYPYAMPLQWGFSLPCFMQYPPHTIGEVTPAFPSSCYQVHGAFSLPVSSAFTPYQPLPNNKSYPWFPFVPAAGGAAQPPVDSAASRSPPHSEGKVQYSQGSGKEEDTGRNSMCELALAVLPVVREAKVPTLPLVQEAETPVVSVSASITNDDIVSHCLPLPKQVHHQEATTLSFPQVNSAAKLHSERRKDSSACQKFLAGRRQSLPLGTAPKEAKVVRFNSLMGEVLKPNSNDIAPQSKSEECKSELGNRKLPQCGEASRAEPQNGSYGEDMSEQDQGEDIANTVIPSVGLGLEVAAPTKVNKGKVEGQSTADLPWVSTTGIGPSGKTIHGVMYITKGKQACLICSCHGKHMSPFEFVQHSGSSDLSNPERSIIVNSFPSVNKLAPTPV